MKIREYLERITKAVEDKTENVRVFSTVQAARYVGVSPTTLERLRPEYPDVLPMVRTSDRRVGYDKRDLDKFIELRKVSNVNDDRKIKRLRPKESIVHDERRIP